MSNYYHYNDDSDIEEEEVAKALERFSE